MIFDGAKHKILLTKKTDNGEWCLPGGKMEPGESASECCVSEVLEETGLTVALERLVGVYSSPNRIVEYTDCNRKQGVDLLFEAAIIGGDIRTTEGTTDVGYFP